MSNSFPLAEIDSILRDDPGYSAFVDYGEFLRREGRHGEALVTLLRGISVSPAADRARLVLARVLYEIDCIPFAVQELESLAKAHPHSRSVRKLLEAIDPHRRDPDAAQTAGTSDSQNREAETPRKGPTPSARASAEQYSPSSPYQEESVIGETELLLDDIDLLDES